MTREEAIERARETYGEGESFWIFRPEEAQYFDGPSELPIYGAPQEPHWYIPLAYDRPGVMRVGSSRAVLVIPGTGVVRRVTWGE